MKVERIVRAGAFALASALTMTSGLAVAQQAPPVDFGDLIILYRDANGVPYLTVDNPDTTGVDESGCWQPLPSADCSIDCELVAGVGGVSPPDVIPVDGATCAVEAACATCTQEVDFGRINEARSSDAVFESQLEDVLVNLATADCVTLDPAGRLVATRVDADLSVLVSTIDSPLQNLAIYRQLMLTGTVGVPLPGETFDTAARGLGAASDKAGEVNVDLVAYLNSIMGLSDPLTPTVLGKICILVKEEVQGTVGLVQKCFLNYGPDTADAVGADYQYARVDNFSTTEESLPSPAYIPTDTSYGRFEYLALVPASDPPTFQIVQGPILDAVFCLDADPDSGECLSIDPGFIGGNIGGFAQASDDTRAVIQFMHENQVPVDFETPVPCTPDPTVIAYDVLISDVSGLQVPRNIVDGSEGREFIVTVTNASGSADPATGTVTVTAVPEAGGPIVGSPWVFEFTDLQVGQSQSFIQFFSIDLGQRTTINWEAVAFAPDDVNPTNNTVTAVSNVKVTGGGGGGGPP